VSELAIYGGPLTIQPDEIKPWPVVDEEDDRLVLDALHAEKQAYGPHNQAVQEEFAAWNGNEHAIFTNSGTAALHMGLAGCGVGAGDHVLVTAYTWSSSATCILHHNAIPIFVDIDFDTINMDTAKIEAAITPRTKAIVAVNLHGLCLNFDEVMAVARKHNLKVIEDCCQAHGAQFHGRNSGTFGDAAAFSFNQNKCMCSGEGGPSCGVSARRGSRSSPVIITRTPWAGCIATTSSPRPSRAPNWQSTRATSRCCGPTGSC